MKLNQKIMMLLLMVIALGVRGSGVDPSYQRAVFEIKNNTQHVEIVNLFDSEGNWQTPWVNKSSFALAPNQTYRNTLNSIEKNGGLENYTSIVVSLADHPKHNYLIFATSDFSQGQYISGDIFDGLGSMFVASWTNECKDRTVDGYVFCRLIINE